MREPLFFKKLVTHAILLLTAIFVFGCGGGGGGSDNLNASFYQVDFTPTTAGHYQENIIGVSIV